MGCYLMLSVQRFEARREMLQHIKNHLSNSELTAIRINLQNKHELHWEETNEFSYRGEMYDVVKIETSGNQTVYFCIADHRETELLQQLEIQIDKDKSTKNSTNGLVKSIIKLIPKLEDHLENDLIHLSNPKNRLAIHTFISYNSIKLELTSPPPKNI